MEAATAMPPKEAAAAALAPAESSQPQTKPQVDTTDEPVAENDAKDTAISGKAEFVKFP
jgi:hypothetical protein